MTAHTFRLKKFVPANPLQVPAATPTSKLEWTIITGDLSLELDTKGDQRDLVIQVRNDSPRKTLFSETFPMLNPDATAVSKVLHSACQACLRYQPHCSTTGQADEVHQVVQLLFLNSKDTHRFLDLLRDHFFVTEAKGRKRVTAPGRKKASKADSSLKQGTLNRQITQSQIMPVVETQVDHEHSLAGTTTRTSYSATSQAPEDTLPSIGPSALPAIPGPLVYQTSDLSSRASTFAPGSVAVPTSAKTQPETTTDILEKIKKDLLKGFTPSTITGVQSTPDEPLMTTILGAQLSEMEDTAVTSVQNSQSHLTTSIRLSSPLITSSLDTESLNVFRDANHKPNEGAQQAPLIIFSPEMYPLDRHGTGIVSEYKCVPDSAQPIDPPSQPYSHVGSAWTGHKVSSETDISQSILSLDELYPPLRGEAARRVSSGKRKRDDVSLKGGTNVTSSVPFESSLFFELQGIQSDASGGGCWTPSTAPQGSLARQLEGLIESILRLEGKAKLHDILQDILSRQPIALWDTSNPNTYAPSHCRPSWELLSQHGTATYAVCHDSYEYRPPSQVGFVPRSVPQTPCYPWRDRRNIVDNLARPLMGPAAWGTYGEYPTLEDDELERELSQTM